MTLSAHCLLPVLHALVQRYYTISHCTCRYEYDARLLAVYRLLKQSPFRLSPAGYGVVLLYRAALDLQAAATSVQLDPRTCNRASYAYRHLSRSPCLTMQNPICVERCSSKSSDLLGPRAGGPTTTVSGHLTHSPARSDRARCPAPGNASRRRLLTMTKPKSKRKREAVTPAKEKQPVVEEPATEKFSPQLKLDFSKTFSPKQATISCCTLARSPAAGCGCILQQQIYVRVVFPR
jgi:hypothetical protein